MDKDKKYYTFVYDHEIDGPFPIFTQGNNTQDYDGYYTNEELLSVESKIFNQIKDKDKDKDRCSLLFIYQTIFFYFNFPILTVTQYDNEEDAKSHIACKQNWHKTYSLKKLLDEQGKGVENER